MVELVEDFGLVPEEDCDWALKKLISRANQQQEITGTIGSTIASSGKGWMLADERDLQLRFSVQSKQPLKRGP